MKRLRVLIPTVLLYAVFLGFLGYHLHQRIRYRGVEDWPWVQARIVDRGGDVVLMRREGFDGSSYSTFDTSFVVFEYEVDGRRYRGERVTPDGGSLPPNSFAVPWRAYYKPSSPEVAVLNPVAYQGATSGFIAVLCGVIVGVHFWCAVGADRLLGWRLRRSRPIAGAGSR